MTFGQQRLNHGDLLRDVVDRPRLDVGRQAVKARAVGMKLRRPAGGEFAEGLPGLLGIADRLVIHVGDVAHVKTAQAAGFEGSPQHVLQHKRAEIADVCRPVDGRPAAVKAKRRPVEGAQVPVGPGQGVK